MALKLRFWNLALVYDYDMKKLLLLLLSIAFCGCAADMPECFRNAGATVRYEVPAETFTQIEVGEGIAVVLRQGAQQRIEIATGENIREAISATVNEGKLTLRNGTSCNWVRDYNSTTVYVTAPDIDKIYSASQFDVRSDNVLAYPSLTLQSGMFSDTPSGVFDLELDTANLVVEDNQSAYFKISGHVANASVSFYSGDARFDGSGLTLQNLYVFHRSSNDIIAAPTGNVTGTLYSTGNLVLKSTPVSVDVAQLYHGRVIYE